MPELPASSPRHLIHGASSAFTTASGVPTNFKFTYGTWSCPDTGDLSALGVITDYSLAPIGDAENLKDGSGATLAHVIKDPGWEITASVMVHSQPESSAMGPRRMDVIEFFEKVEGAQTLLDPGSGLNVSQTLRAVVTACTVKWAREGWTMLEVKAESRDSMNLQSSFGVSINETGGVEEVIYTAA